MEIANTEIQLFTPSHIVYGDDGLQFSELIIREDYREKWNVYRNDFICLTKNGQLIRNTLYRIGGINTPNLSTDKYFMLLKYVEAFYPDDITDVAKRKPHLSGRWCILDKEGNEKVEFEPFSSPYLVKGSQIYSIRDKYYNIETGEFYCDAGSSMQSKDFLFLENRWDKNESKRGIMKINKHNGKWELFP